MRLPEARLQQSFAKDYAELNVGAIQQAIEAGKLAMKACSTRRRSTRRASPAAARTACAARQGRYQHRRQLRVAGASRGARKAIEARGGSVEVIELVSAADKHKAKHRKGQRSQPKGAIERHCERAKQPVASRGSGCFVADAPRNDGLHLI
jgi:large subunit ribosomal protein L15